MVIDQKVLDKEGGELHFVHDSLLRTERTRNDLEVITQRRNTIYS